VIETRNIIPDFELATPSVKPVTAKIRKPVPSQEAGIGPPGTSEETKRAIEGIEKELTASKQLSMYYDSDLDRAVVTIVNEESREVIRQIPSPESISFVKKFRQVVGLVVNRRV
jgi:flagellar protein FlaG